MQITYFGHSAFQIESGDTTLLFDPFITGNKHTEGVVTADELDPDFILLTHAHSDHWGDTPDIAARSGAQVVANFEIVTYLQNNHGHDNAQQMNTGGWWTFPWGRAKLTYARHSSSFPDGTYGGNPNGYILHLEDKCVYNLGDTALFAEMEWIGEDHTIDLAFVPIGDCFTMGPDDALRAVKMLKPKHVVPVHYGTFPFIEVDAQDWARRVREEGIEASVPAPGETLVI